MQMEGGGEEAELLDGDALDDINIAEEGKQGFENFLYISLIQELKL